MGNSCAIDREEFTKQDIFDFRFKGDKTSNGQGINSLKSVEKKQAEESTLPEYKEHLKNIEKDPYEDKYAKKGDSLFVIGKAKTNT